VSPRQARNHITTTKQLSKFFFHASFRLPRVSLRELFGLFMSVMNFFQFFETLELYIFTTRRSPATMCQTWNTRNHTALPNHWQTQDCVTNELRPQGIPTRKTVTWVSWSPVHMARMMRSKSVYVYKCLQSWELTWLLTSWIRSSLVLHKDKVHFLKSVSPSHINKGWFRVAVTVLAG